MATDTEDHGHKYRRDAEEKVSRLNKMVADGSRQQVEHELRIHQVELEMQNQELRETQERLQQSLDRISCLYHQSPVGFVTLDAKGQIQDLNESFAAMLGVRVSNLHRRFLAEYCTEHSAGILRQRLPALFSRPEGKIIHLTLKNNSGKMVDVELEGRKLPDVKQLACTVIDRTERTRAEAKYRLLFENMTAGFALHEMVYDAGGTPSDYRYLEVNPAFERLTGLKAEKCIGRTVKDLLPTTEQDWIDLFGSVAETGKPATGRNYARELDRHFDVFAFTPHRNQVAAIFLDITERTRAEQALREKTEELEQTNLALEQLATVFTHAREGVLITDPGGTIIDVNHAFCRISGYPREEIVGQNPRLFKSDRHSREFYAFMWQALVTEGHWSGEVWNRRKGGESHALLLTISAVRDHRGAIRHFVALHTDITTQKEQQKQLEFIAHYDTLTGLPNRKLFDDRLQQALAHGKRSDRPLAVVYIDLDGFKAVNDGHGHDAGDYLLRTLAEKMKQCLREGDTIARFGGDEFVVILTDLTDAHTSVPCLKRLLAAAARPIPYQGHQLQVSSSIGVAFFSPTDTLEADQLLRQADQAMYQAKLAGKNRYHIFDAEHDLALRDHHENLTRIRQAFINHEFTLYFQPKINMRTNAVLGVEALIRWRHPDRGLLKPGDFLPVLDKHPLGITLGEWVIDNALHQIDQWRKEGLNLPVSVNIAANHLQHQDFISRLEQALAAYPEVKPELLSLELLETGELADVSQVTAVISACVDMGIQVALDDFGTGYSSLTYLRRLPVQFLKIDQSFIREMIHHQDDLAIIKGILALAGAFRRTPIAEGVETVEQGILLLDLGCDLAQGSAIALPMPAAEIPEWLTGRRPRTDWYRRLPRNNA